MGTSNNQPDLATPSQRRAAVADDHASTGWRVPRDGTRFWAALRRHKGGLRGFTHVTCDVSIRRRPLSLRRIEALARSILDALPAHVAVLDHSGQIIAVNSAWECFAREQGDPAAAARRGVGANYLDVCRNSAGAGDVQAANVRDALQALLHGTLDEFSMEFSCGSSSERRWFLLHATVLKNDHGGAVVTHMPITELMLAKERLRESEAKYRRIVETAREGMWALDAQGKTTYTNPQLAAMLGYSADDMLGRHLFDFMDDAGRARAEALPGRPWQGVTESHDFCFRRRDGSELWAIVSAKSILDDQGQYLGTMGMITDVTERKRAELALRNSENRLRAIVETASDAIITVDARGTIELVNPAAERMFGYAAAELLGRNVNLLMPSPYREQHDRCVERYGRTGERSPVGVREIRARRRDGKTFPVELAIGKHDSLFTGIVRDVTARRELERQVLEVAATRQRQIGQELHDSVGQELTGLGLMADALAQRLKRTLTAEGVLAAKVAAGLERVHQQVRAISYRIVPVEVDPQGLRVALQDLATRTCEQVGNACTFDTSGPIELPDAETATHLFGIAQEALSNALRHGGDSAIRLALRGEGDALVLTIEDHGVGLPPVGAGRRTCGLGIRMMQYRASAIGATLNIGPSNGGGTTVSCFLSRRPPQDPETIHQ